MGLITNLLKEKHDQEWREKEAQIGGLSQILGTQDPSIKPETKEHALDSLMDIVMGGKANKRGKTQGGDITNGHHPLKAILGSVLGLGGHLGLPGHEQQQGDQQQGPVPAQPGPQAQAPDSLKTAAYDPSTKVGTIPVSDLPLPNKPMAQQVSTQQQRQSPNMTPQGAQPIAGGRSVPQTAQGPSASPQGQETPSQQQGQQQPWWRGKLTYTPEEMEAQQLKVEQTRQRIAKQIQQQQMQDRREALKVAGLDPDSDAAKDYYLTGALPTHFGNPTAAGTQESTRNVTLELPDGTKRSVAQGVKTRKIYDIGTGEEIELPQGAKVAAGGAGGKPPADPAQFRLWKQAYMSQGFSEAESEKMAGELLLRNEDTMIGGRVAGAIAHTQQAGQQRALSGIGGYMPSGGIPGAGGASAGGRSTNTATGVTPSRSTPRKAGGAGGGTLSPAKIQAAIDNDPQMSLAVDQILKITPGGRGGAAGAVGVEAGLRKLSKLTGLSKPDIQAELTSREGVKAALKLGQQRASGFDQAAGFVDQMGKLVLQAKQQMGGGNTEKFMQRVKNHWNQNYHGDPSTDALVTALNGFQSAYARAISGGQLSVAQTQVAAQERAGKILDLAMKGSEMKAVIEQAGKELRGEKSAIDSNNQQQRKLLTQPFGAFVQGGEEPSGASVSNGLSGGGSEPVVQKNKKTGAFRYSTDGGKTWQMGKPHNQ